MATVPPFDNITIKLSGQPHRSNVCLYKNTIFFEKRKPIDSVEFELYFYFKLSVFHTCCGSGDSSIFQNYRLWLNKITDFGYFLYSFVGRHIPHSKKVGLMKKEIGIKTRSKKIRKSSSSYTFSLLDIFLTSPALLSAY